MMKLRGLIMKTKWLNRRQRQQEKTELKLMKNPVTKINEEPSKEAKDITN